MQNIQMIDVTYLLIIGDVPITQGFIIWHFNYLLAEGVHKHPHGWSGPDHEGRIAACVPGKVHLKFFGRLQQAGEEYVAEFVDVEQRGSFDAKLPYSSLHCSSAVLQKELTGFGGLAWNTDDCVMRQYRCSWQLHCIFANTCKLWCIMGIWGPLYLWL